MQELSSDGNLFLVEKNNQNLGRFGAEPTLLHLLKASLQKVRGQCSHLLQTLRTQLI